MTRWLEALFAKLTAYGMLAFVMAFSVWDCSDVVGVILVFLGVVGEVVVPRRRFPPFSSSGEAAILAEAKARWETDRALWERAMKWWEHVWENVLIVGLALELLALPHHFIETASLQRAASEAGKNAAQANARASSNELARVALQLEFEKY